MLQVVVHVLRDQVVGHAAVDEEWRKPLELGPQLLQDFDVHFREPEPTFPHHVGKDPRCGLRVGVSRDDSLAAWHLLHHCAGVERIGVVPQDALGWLRIFVLVGADACLVRHVLACEDQGGAADYSRLQHVVRLFVGGIQFGWLVTLAALQRLTQDVLLGYTREGDRVFEDVHPKCGVELLHLLKGFKEWGNVQVVVVLQPVAEGAHPSLLEDALAVVVLLGREYVGAFELGVPSKVWGKPGVIQLVWAVEPLVREPGLVQVWPHKS